MGNVQIQSKGHSRRKIFQQRRSVSPNGVYFHRSLILDKNAIRRDQRSSDNKPKNCLKGFKHIQKLQNKVGQYRVTLPSQMQKINQQTTQRNCFPVTRELTPIKTNQPLTQRNNNSDRQYYHNNNQQVQFSLQDKNPYKYHKKQFQNIIRQRKNKKDHLFNAKGNQKIHQNSMNLNLTQKRLNCRGNEGKIVNYPKYTNMQSPIDSRCNLKLQKLKKLREEIEKYSQNNFNTSIFQNSRIEQKKMQPKEDSMFNYQLTERRIQNEQTPDIQNLQALETERKYKKRSNRNFKRDECIPTRVVDSTDSKRDCQFQVQKSSSVHSGPGLQQNYERCNILVNKVKDFNDFLSQVKSKIRDDIVSNSKSHNCKNNKDSKGNECQFRLDSTGSAYSEKDQSIVQIEGRSKILIQDAKVQNLKSFNLNLKLQNEKIQLEKYKRLFENQLSKQHSIQKITIQDKVNSKGDASGRQKILTIEYYEPQQDLSNQVKQNLQEKIDRRSESDYMECSIINNRSQQIGQKYRKVSENVKQLGILLGINDFRKQQQGSKEILRQNCNQVPQSRQKKQSKVNQKNHSDFIKDRLSSNQEVDQEQQTLGNKEIDQKVNKRKKRIQNLLQHVQFVNKKQQKIESTLYEWLQRTQPSYELQSSLDLQY